MIELIGAGGVMMYPLLVSGALVLLLGGWSARRLFGRDARAEPAVRAAIDGVLFWGSFSLVIGFLGTVIGVIIAAGAIETAGEVSVSLVWGGIKVALITTALGALILSGASLIWFALRLRLVALERSLARLVVRGRPGDGQPRSGSVACPGGRCNSRTPDARLRLSTRM